MIPAILIELASLAEEGYLIFRRILAARDIAGDVFSALEAGNDSFERSLRSHVQIEGDFSYLFLLGQVFMANHTTKLALDQQTVNGIILLALIETAQSKPSPDVRSMVHSFCHFLGSTLQLQDDRALDTLEDARVQQLKGGVIAEPVTRYIQQNQGSISPETRSILLGLGLKPEAWDDLTALILSGDLGSMLSSLERTVEKVPVHQTATMLGLVIMGARAAYIERPEDIEVFSGPEGFALAGICMPMHSLDYGKSGLIVDDKNITQEMVSATSLKIMKAKGYVKVNPNSNPDGASWIPLSDARIQAELDKEGSATGKYSFIQREDRSTLTDFTSTTATKVWDTIIDKISAKVQGAVTDKLSAGVQSYVIDKGKHVFEAFFKRYYKKLRP